MAKSRFSFFLLKRPSNSLSGDLRQVCAGAIPFYAHILP
jgi:hypothetical protein